jgi:hypothetical protein
MADPRNYPVLSATLVAPVVAWLAARYLPGLELTDEQATVIATGILAAGSVLATTLVRSRRTLPDPTATRSNSAVEVRPTTYRIRDEPDLPPGESEPFPRPKPQRRARPPDDPPGTIP